MIGFYNSVYIVGRLVVLEEMSNNNHRWMVHTFSLPFLSSFQIHVVEFLYPTTYDHRRLFSERWETFGLEVGIDLVDMVHELSLEVIPHLRLMFCRKRIALCQLRA